MARRLNVERDNVETISCFTEGLFQSMKILGIDKGDEVIIPSIHFIGAINAIKSCGAKPVFCDIDDISLFIDLEKAEDLVSPRTKAVIVMDYGCMLCDHQGIEEFARTHDVRVIHDAAHSFGSKYKGRSIGSFSDICMFSFDPVKNVTCIDGGILIVQTEKELKMIQEMRLIGMGQPPAVMYKNQRAWTYDVTRIGFRYHMANLHAAIGLAQLGKIEMISAKRQNVCRHYSEKLREIKGIAIPKTDFNDIVPFLYYIRVPEDKRDTLRGYLRDRGVDTGIHWQPGQYRPVSPPAS